MNRGLSILLVAATFAIPQVVAAKPANAPPPVVIVAPTGAKPADPRATAAVDRLLTLSGTGDQMESFAPQIIDALMPILVRGNSGQEQVIKSILREELVTIMAGLTPEILARSRQAYLEHFTAEELEALVAFLETPVGKKMTRETPAIMRELFVFGQEAGRAAVSGAMPRILDRMRAANLAVPTGT